MDSTEIAFCILSIFDVSLFFPQKTVIELITQLVSHDTEHSNIINIIIILISYAEVSAIDSIDCWNRNEICV